MRTVQRSFLLLVALLIGCTQLGLPTAQSFEEKLIAGYATVESLNKTATSLLNAKKITSADAQHILDQTRNAKAGLDVARAIHAIDPTGADSKITALRTALVALQSYLTSKEK